MPGPATLGLSLDSFYQLRDWLKERSLQGPPEGAPDNPSR